MSLHRRLLQVVSTVVILSIVLSDTAPNPGFAQSPNGIERHLNPQTGKVSFISPQDGSVLAALDALGTLARPDNPALALAKRFSREFGLQDAEHDLFVIETKRAENGRITARYQQTYQGIPVMGGELIVNTNQNGDLYSMNGEVSPNLSLSIQSQITSEQARHIAIEAIAEWHAVSPEDFTTSEPELWIYDESLLRVSTRPPELVWRMDVIPTALSMPVRELVLVNARRGNISLHFNQFDTAWSLSGTSGRIPDIAPTPTVAATETRFPTATPETVITPTPNQEIMLEDASLSSVTWYVTTSGSNSNACSTPTSPCLTIDGAIAKSSTGDTIRVAAGTYTNTTNNVVTISKGITLSGGWNDAFTVQNGASIIDGGGVRNGILVNGIGSTVTVEYFVVQNSSTGADSGGIYIYGANFTLKNSAVINNVASRGAGLFLINNASLTVLNSTISSNQAGTSGGGIYAINSLVTINNSTIAYNTSNGTGGGLTRESGSIAIINSILAKNTAQTNGPDCSGSISSSDHNILGNTAGCTVIPGTGDKFNVDPLLEASFTGILPLHALQVTSPAVNAGDTSTCLATDQRGQARPFGSACDMGAHEYAENGGLMGAGGSNQTSNPNLTFALPFTVHLVDGSTNPISGAIITFSAPASGASGTFADSGTHVTTAITDSDGFATSALFTANDRPGSYLVTATVDAYGLSTVFSLRNILADYYVTPNGSNSSSCTTPVSPCLTINGALAKASAGDIIAVAGGIYTGSATEVVLINKNITLSGGWNSSFTLQEGTSVIDGEGTRRGISATNVNVLLDRFTVQNGFHTTMGGGIYSYGGSLTINNSFVTRNISEWLGAGIYSHGTLLIDHSTISGNRAGKLGLSGGGGGGGIISYGAAVINNSAVSQNSIVGGFDGSGIVNSGTLLQLKNSTVSGNSGAAAIYNSSSIGTVALNNSTVFGNTSGGVRTSFGTITMQNSILANNNSSGFANDCTATLKSFGHNIIGSISGCNFTVGASDQIGVNPMLSSSPAGVLLYHPLASGSPAIDAADPTTCLATDQRGMARPQGGGCDIGAYEYTPSGPAVSFGVSSGSYQRAGASLPFALPLAAYVVDDVGSPVGGVEVTFAAPASGPSGTFADTGTKSTTVISNEEGVAVSSVITSNAEVGMYTVTATVSGLPGSAHFTLTNGAWYVSSIGNNANSCSSPSAPCLTISAAMAKSANADVIMVSTGTYSPVNITKSLVISGGWNNSFSAQTGYSTIAGTSSTDGIAASGSNVSISRFVVQTSRFGISHSGGVLSFHHGALISNANGVSNTGGELTLLNTTISGNRAGAYTGSAILNTNGTVKIRFSTITDNTGGYAIVSQNAGAQLEIGNSIVAGNSGGDCSIGNYNTTSTGHNIFGNSPACAGSLNFVPDPTDRLGLDPKLTVLLPGGYHAIQSNSPAINNADLTACPVTDQRGVARPQGEGCDTGAYEFTPAGTVAAFGVASGSNQRAAPTLAFALPLAVYVIDTLGNPVSGVTVTFTAPAAGPSGTFANTGARTTSVTTNDGGLAVSSLFSANAQLGTYQVTAMVSGLSGSANFALTNSAWYVSSNGFDTNSCSTPAAPCRTLNAVNTKAANGDVVEVAAGTYAAASITKNLTILGGWNSSFSAQTGYSTVDGNGSHGISVSSSAVSISRFIVRNSDFGIYHSTGQLNFERGALVANENGLYNLSGNVILTNTTISGNRSAGYVGSAISNVSGTVTVHYSTITNNAGSEAIRSVNGSALIVIGNSILAGNPAGDCDVRGPNLTSRGYNIFGSNPVCDTFVSPVGTDPTDQMAVNPQLLPLFPNGYHPLLLGSPAIDAASALDCPAVDQRNLARPAAARCDIGAFEFTPTGTAPKYMFALEGSGQILLVNTEASTRLKAMVLDEDGDSVKGVPVTFAAPMQGASVVFASSSGNTSTVITDGFGIATSPAFSANFISGSYIVLATASSVATPVNFSLNNSLTALQPSIRTYTVDNLSTLPGIFLCDQSQPGCTNGTDTHADAAHNYAIGTYSLYAIEHNRNSIDNAGMPVISTVHYRYQYANAGWTGSQMVYGDAYGFPLSDDVVAHELTHGVTQYESDLFYYYQSGAINESLADLWGEYYDQRNGQGNDAPGVKWLLGEDISGLGAIRSMSNPTDFGDPDKMSSSYYYEGPDDNGGVHTNSGVNNKAVSLLVDGGTFNNKAVAGLGWEKTIAIYYETNTNLLSSGADYSDLYYALQQACSNLIGQEGITAGDCIAVKAAIDAVEMNTQPALGFNPEAPYCDMGNPIETLFSDNLESGTDNWTFGNGQDIRWQLDSPYGPYAHSGKHFLYANDYPARTTDANAQLVPLTIPLRTYLHFSHAYDFHTGSYYYDGGVLEYSLDGGETWSDAGPLIDFNGYRGTIHTGSNNPLQGRSAFVGTSHGYISTRLNLASLAGETVAFRWRMGLDISGLAWGWWVDDVQIYQCPEPEMNAPTVSSIVRAGPQTTSARSVDFIVTFSEPVVGVDDRDFSLDTSTTITGAAIKTVHGSNEVYTVTATTGSGNGTLGLTVPETASITDLPGNPLAELPFDSGQFYTVTKNTNASVYIGSSSHAVGTYSLESGQSIRQGFVGMDSGPVRIQSNHDIPLMAAERVIYRVDNVPTSFSEMMAMPASQLDSTYWLPWYNNKDLNTQLRFANVSDVEATVQIRIGSTNMGSFVLAPGASIRRSFPGIDGGPVRIESNVPIVAAERVLYKVNGIDTSFSEMMAMPASQLDTTYWLPWYNNKDLNTQLRFANVSDTEATVQITIGTMNMGSFVLAPGASLRRSFTSVDAGPVKIQSNVNIVAAERVIYRVNNADASFSEMMAMPNSQLDGVYWLPWYNNKDLDTQLRFANVSDTEASVHVFIGGVEVDGSPFTLAPGASMRRSFPNVDRGPVKIESNVPIVAAERVIYKVNNIPTSFSEMMGLPDSLLDVTYWLPWYNNKDLDTQIRFGVP